MYKNSVGVDSVIKKNRVGRRYRLDGLFMGKNIPKPLSYALACQVATTLNSVV
jgi:hypothetical protein